jgi:RNAse (barnase) inhibitor barstar
VGIILFFDEMASYNFYEDSFIANMSTNVRNKYELLNDMQIKLKFPDYFGYNWDAAYDCLCDFTWIKEKNIVIIYQKIPLLDEKTMKQFLILLREVAEDWKDREYHNVFIVLPLINEKHTQSTFLK